MPELLSLIRNQIRSEGPISLATFMDLCLTHPQYGYYTTRTPIGAAGDFTTAPEMTQVFGELIGLWCIDAWQKLGKPSSFVLCEIGGGRGTLMSDALRAAKLMPEFSNALHLYMMDASPAFRTQQQEVLKEYNPKHITALTELPDMPLLLIANEFFDALPIRQFMRTQDEWKERSIGLTSHDALAFVLTTPVDPPTFDMADDTIIETCPSAIDWASQIARPIVKNTGAALIIDYGDDEVVGETLQALSNHRAAHPLSMPGHIDLTAHVSFEPIGNAARKIGCRVRGPIPQGEWLLALGARERTAQLCKNANEAQQRSLQTALARLTDPEAMGQIFKVMCFTNRNGFSPAGFDE